MASAGIRLEICPFLGSYLPAAAIDSADTGLALHGHAHAHAGSGHGFTSGGVPVRNVAQPVIRHAFAVYELHVRSAGASSGPGLARTSHV